MAKLKRTNTFFLLLFLIINTSALTPPRILSFRVLNSVCALDKCVLSVKVFGNFDEWAITYTPAERGDQCNEIVGAPKANDAEIEIENNERNLYFCSMANGNWQHEGRELYLDVNDVIAASKRNENTEDLNNIENLEITDNKIEIELMKDLSTDVDVNREDSATETSDFVDDIGLANIDKVQDIDSNDVERRRRKRQVNEDKNATNSLGDKQPPTIKLTSVQASSGASSEIKVQLSGEGFTEDTFVAFSQSSQAAGETCVNATGQYKVENAAGNSAIVTLPQPLSPENGKFYICASHEQAGPYTHLGNEQEKILDTTLTKRDVRSSETQALVVHSKIKLMGLRVEEAAKEPKIVDEVLPSVLAEYEFNMRLFGEGFTEDTVFAFTHHEAAYGTACMHLLDGVYKVQNTTSESAFIQMTAPKPEESYKFYFCFKNVSSEEFFIHQGSENFKILAVHNKLLPLWASLILIVILLMLASLFSGLNLGLMALDRTELKIIANTGTEKERKYARAIMPVRSHGNYLLCTILLSNVAVNSTFTVILDDLTSGLVAVIGSTLAIVFIAEITPQAICARHGLFIGAKSIWIMKIVMGICAPLAWPTSKLLDYFLGEEIGTHYNRERLKELVKVTNHVNDLDKEEVNIISGALDLRKKKVKDVMTKLKDCFMLPINSVLDFETMSEIVKSGYSRIPVYEDQRGNIVTVLFIKDLAFVDPDDNTPLRTLCQYYQNPCNFVFEDVTLDVMLKQFKEGHKGHMAFVQRIDREGDGDPVYETVGLVTLEDVIEEMIQAEIVDETDVFTDNRTKKLLSRPVNKFHDLAAFAGHQHQRVHVSPQLIMATFQFLTASVDAFRPELISETVLRRLLKQDIIQHIKLRGDEDKNDPKRFVYHEGKAADYFILILEGRVEVTVGRENLVFEAGPFTYFGVQALTQNVGLAEAPAPSTLGSLQNLNMDSMLRHTFVPDYSVKAIAELYYLTIKRSMYLAAKRATLMEKGVLNKGGTNEQIEPEVDKLLRENEKIEETVTMDEKPKLPASASPQTNSTFKTVEKEPVNPEEEKLLK